MTNNCLNIRTCMHKCKHAIYVIYFVRTKVVHYVDKDFFVEYCYFHTISSPIKILNAHVHLKS